MARKARIQYKGASYHVVNRGNYRRELFESVGAAQAFLKALEATVMRFGWVLHAYVLMRNHYHLVITTPHGNLVDGMHWLQGTYATRFNRYRNEQGHLFQGRYHAGLLEEEEVMAHVVDYVHLNPVRAKLIAKEHVEKFRWSSLNLFVRSVAWKGMESALCLRQRGPEGANADWPRYLDHLRELADNLAEQERLGWKGFSRGWALGSRAWKASLIKDYGAHALDPGLDREDLQQLKTERWESALETALQALGKSREELRDASKQAKWKYRLACQLKAQHGVSGKWMAEHMEFKNANSLRSLLSRHERLDC
jgi:REP element-mobilizing transposase RayT